MPVRFDEGESPRRSLASCLSSRRGLPTLLDKFTSMSTTSTFKNLSFDEDTGQVFCTVECSQLGKVKIVLDAEDRSVPFEIEIIELPGTDLVETKFSIPKETLGKIFRDYHKLDAHWGTIWPGLITAFKEIREEYGSKEEMTSTSCRFSLSAPGSVGGCQWIMELELEPWDGNFSVEFDRVGKILNSNATF